MVSEVSNLETSAWQRWPIVLSNSAIFKLVVSSAVLLHDVSARAGDVSMGIAVFSIG